MCTREQPLALTPDDARTGTPEAPPQAQLAKHQTLAISRLRRRLGVPEHLLPCLHLALLNDPSTHSLILPLGERTAYVTLKEIVAHFDGQFAALRRLEESERRSRKRLNRSPPISSYQPNGLSPEQVAAARVIIRACEATPSTPDEIAAARAECFRQLAALKDTGDFRILQRYIDVYLNPRSEPPVRGPGLLADTWREILRQGEQLTSAPTRRRIFIAYQTADRWIAELIHSALAAARLDLPRCPVCASGRPLGRGHPVGAGRGGAHRRDHRRRAGRVLVSAE